MPDFVERKNARRLGRFPRLAQRVLDGDAGERGVGEKLAVRSAMPVLRLARRHRQDALDEFDVEVEQKRSVKEQAVFFPALGVAGNFQVGQREIADAANFKRVAENRAERVVVALEDVVVGLGDAGKRTGFGDAEDEREIQAAGALDDGAAAGAAAQDRHAGALRGVEMNFGRGLVGVAEDDERRR